MTDEELEQMVRLAMRLTFVPNVGADSNLSHRADAILSQGWKPTLRGSTVDKCRSLAGSSMSSVLC